nr:cysteine-rich VLP protein [Oscillibacter sp.]
MGSLKLTPGERVTIRNLVTSMYSNYDSESGCLPLDYGGCYMLDKWWTGAYCKCFQNAVLPNDPKLEATLLGRAAPEMDACAICGKAFVSDETRAYCSPACQAEGNRRRSRERMRKKRRSDKA